MNLRVVVFAIVCVAQLAWASAALFSGETRLETGQVWLFRTAPVDPADLLRGRYVALFFRDTSAPTHESEPFAPGQVAFAQLVDDDGFARIYNVARDRPPGGDYLDVRVRNQSGNTVSFEFPIDRFYMPEAQAPIAERLHRQRQAESWAEVRVHEGQATLLDVRIEGVSLMDAARAELEKEPTQVPVPTR